MVDAKIRRIRELKQELEAKIAVLIATPADQISEEDEERLYKELSDKLTKATFAEFDAQLVTVKTNDWSTHFLSSFDGCIGKKITFKQTKAFERLLPVVERKTDFHSSSGKSYLKSTINMGVFFDKVYEVAIFPDCGYLTIRDLITI